MSQSALQINNFTVETVSTNTQMQSFTGYITNASGLITFTLPPTPNKGDIIRVMGLSSGGWSIVQNTNQYIIFGDTNTTVSSGSLSSTKTGDCVLFMNVDSGGLVFMVLSSIGNLTVA